MTAVPPEPADLVIVPEADLASAILRGERAETFTDLRRRIRQHLASNVELADPIAVRLLLTEVVPTLASGDPWLGPIAIRGGPSWLSILDALDDAIAQLRGREVALAIVARGSGPPAQRASLLLQVLRRVDRKLASVGLVDPRRESEIVATAIAQADVEDVVRAVGARRVRSRGIVTWPLPDLALFRGLDAALSRAHGAVCVELPVFERGFDAQRERDPLDTVIDALASALDAAPLTTPIAPTLGDLRLGGPTGPEPLVPVEIRTAVDAEAHADAIADAVHAALAGGARPGEVVVAWMSSDDAAARAAVRAMQAAGIAVADPRSTHAGSNLLALAFAALDLVDPRTRRLNAATLLRSSYVEARFLVDIVDEAGARRLLRSVARTLEETRTARPTSDVGLLEATVRASAVPASDERRSRLAAVVRQLDVGIAQLAAGSSRRTHLGNIRKVWALLGLRGEAPERLRRLTDAARETPSGRMRDVAIRAVVRDAAQWAHLEATLEGIERDLARLGLLDVPTPLEVFRHEVGWAIARWVASAPPADGAVRLVAFDELPHEPTALMVFADADAEGWAGGPPRSRLVTPELEARLAEAMDPALRPALQAEPAQLLARLALSVERCRRVVFSVRDHEELDASLGPSAVVRWLETSPGVSRSAWRRRLAPDRPLSRRDATLVSLAGSSGDAWRLVPDAARRAVIEQRRDTAFGRPLSANDPLVATLPRGSEFLEVLTTETGGGERALPATGVDRMASCIFKGFVAEVLRPRRHLTANDVADPRESGILVHAALAAAFNATAALWPIRPRDAAAIVRVGLQAADQVLASEREASSLAGAAATEARSAVRAVLDWSLGDEAWDFASAEQPVGEEAGWGSIMLRRGEAHVRLRGRIDRIDRDHASRGVRVIDYKRTASAADECTASFGETRFQLAIYGRAAELATGLPAVEGIYLATRQLRPESTPRVPPLAWRAAHEKVEGIERFETIVMDLVEAIREGRIEVRPRATSSCAHCDFDGVCRKPRFAPAMTPEDESFNDVSDAETP